MKNYKVLDCEKTKPNKANFKTNTTPKGVGKGAYEDKITMSDGKTYPASII